MKMLANFKSAMTLIAWLAFFIATPAHAAIDSSGLLDNVLARYSAAASTWASIIIDAASWLFWTLVIISMVWTFGMMALRKADIGEFFAEFVRFTIFTGFFWWLLINGPGFASSIYDSLRQISGNATGLGPKLSPSGIVDVGFEIFDRVLDQSSIWSPVDSFTGILIALMLLIILALIGVNMLLLLAAGWVLAYAGVFFLGFGGSRWTSDIAINYYKTVLGVAAQLMAMVLLIGIGKTFLDDYYNTMSKGVSLKEIGVLLIVAVILLTLVNKVPQMLAGIITGASIGNTGIGNFGAGAAIGSTMTAAGMAYTGARMVGSGTVGGAANIAGGASAISAAFQKAQANMSGGDMPGVGSNSGFDGADKGNSDSHKTAGTGDTPYARAAGFANSRGSSSGNFSRAASLAAGTASELTKGVGAKIASGLRDRIAQTPGGRLASSIRESKTDGDSTSSFGGNSLSGKDSK